MLRDVLTNRRLWVALLGFAFCLIFVARSGLSFNRHDDFSVHRARVLYVDNSRLSPDPAVENLYLGRQVLEIEILSGDFVGQRFRMENTLSRFFNIMARENMEMLFQLSTQDGQVVHITTFGHSRGNFMYVFLGLFALVLIVVGRKKGFYAVLSLIFTLSLVVFFMIPLILDGRNPVLLAIVVAALTAVFTFLLVGDTIMKSFAAIGGTITGVAIAGIVGIVAGRFAHISGLHLEHAQEVMHQGGMDIVIRLPLLLFAGIIIASLGAVMDVGMSISSSVFELKKLNEGLGFKELYKSGMNIGRDIIGTMTNTLILAFAGTSLTVLIIIALYELPYLRLINMDLLAVEVIQGVSASIGLVLTVPVTAFFAAFLAAGNFKMSKAA